MSSSNQQNQNKLNEANDVVLSSSTTSSPIEIPSETNDDTQQQEEGIMGGGDLVGRDMNNSHHPLITTRRTDSVVSSSAGSTMSLNTRRQPSRPSPSSSDCVKVAIRIRPLLPLERQEPCLTILDEPPPPSPLAGGTTDGGDDTAAADEESFATSVRVGERRSGVTYTFDCVYGSHTTQAQLFRHSVVPLLNACLEGYNATILAYGQTGSGKTHTILGSSASIESQGVLPRTIFALFDALQQTGSYDDEMMLKPKKGGGIDAANKENPPTNQKTTTNPPDRPCDEWKVQVQFLEIYGEDIRDLLRLRGGGGGDDGGGGSSGDGGSSTLKIRDAVATEEPEVLGVHQPRVYSAPEALQMLQTGRLRRVTASTAMNATSSRSHALFTIFVEQEWRSSSSSMGTGSGGGGGDSSSSNTNVVVRRSKFHFVDLAGSERAKRTQAVGQRLKEGIEINKGLLVLGNVIAALASSSKNNKPFVPYRDSKLTRLLRGSLGGNHKTLMIACVSPSADNLEESLNCLRYANRAKQIQNKAIINLDPTSQYILTLQQHIVKLAQQALYLSNAASSSSDYETRTSANSKAGSLYPKEQLQAIISGESVEAAIAGVRIPDDETSTTSGVEGSNNERYPNSSSSPHGRSAGATTEDDENDTPLPKDAAEESLYWQKAQSAMHQLLSSKGVTTNSDSNSLDDNQDSALMEMTMQKMVDYEREIGELKKALAVERSQRVMIQDEQSWMDHVQHSLQEDRNRLERLQERTTPGGDNENNDDDDEESALVRIEAEENAEQAAVKSWTKKYTGDDMDDGNDDDSGGSHTDPDEDASSLPSPELAPSPRHETIQRDLMDLARSIAAKEELIGQLKTSQERYEQMREFYESKLKEMEQSLMEKEEEREALVKKLEDAQKVKAGGIKSQELKEKLREKEAHIATLKKKSVELRNLTSVSSRNAMELERLTRDVEEMKRRKVDMQKQLTAERKDHANHIKRLQKEAMQKERELSKYKRLTSKKEIEADTANRVAKARLEELGNLRQKFKDTEKKLRVASVKRGVMEKAGLDPVLVGQRDKGKHNIDTNALRDLFDEKVSKVARKEALVNKLAEEWEQHFQLTLERDEVAKNASAEDLENIELQLKYKEDRIRNLAKRLEKEGVSDDVARENVRSDNKESFLFDARFDRVCKAAPPEVAHKSLAKVLFGMVVRERRRVGALARTACSLDERLQSAIEDLEAKDSALRSYVDEQREQVAEMSQNQQKHILSLMELVKGDASVPREKSELESVPSRRRSSGGFDETLLVLANERISLLEKQLEDMEAEAATAKTYRTELEDSRGSLQKAKEESKALEAELQKAYADMSQIKYMLSRMSSRGIDLSRVIAAVDKSLGKSDGNAKSSSKKSSHPLHKAGPLPAALKEAIDFDESDPDDSQSVEPEWASDIMDDLALIAEGKVPPSLKGTLRLDEKQDVPVFERLADPDNYTGTQKQARLRNKSRPKGKPVVAVSSDVGSGEKDDRPGTDQSPRGRQVAGSFGKDSDSDERSRHKEKPTSTIKNRAVARTVSYLRSGETRSSFSRISSPERRPARKLGNARSFRADENGTKTTSRDRHRSNTGEENVFERLSTQTTFAFSIRQNGVPDEEEDQQLQQHHQVPRMTSVDALLEEVLGSSPYNGHSSPDVFERLTKTTTEAYAMKVNRSKDE
ncbi:hypothetical protein ACA910_003303 [Epithemia clementina (nom. ined.)]